MQRKVMDANTLYSYAVVTFCKLQIVWIKLMMLMILINYPLKRTIIKADILLFQEEEADVLLKKAQDLAKAELAAAIASEKSSQMEKIAEANLHVCAVLRASCVNSLFFDKHVASLITHLKC